MTRSVDSHQHLDPVTKRVIKAWLVPNLIAGEIPG